MCVYVCGCAITVCPISDQCPASPLPHLTGQYAKLSCCSSTPPRPDLHAKLLNFSSDITIIHRPSFLARQLCMLGSNGRAYHWTVQLPLVPHATRRDERMAQLQVVVNDVLAQATQARRRHVSVEGQTVVSITHRMRLVQDDPSHTSLQEVYDAHCLSQVGRCLCVCVCVCVCVRVYVSV